MVNITVWLVFPSSEKVSSHPSHDLEQLYTRALTTLGPIKRKKIFKLDTLQMVICWDIYCPKMAAFPTKKNKINTLQELANKKQ